MLIINVNNFNLYKNIGYVSITKTVMFYNFLQFMY